MALNTITPSNREEEYLSAIAGDVGASAPVPSNRREEWLRRIAESQGDQTERLDHIGDQLPIDPVAADVGKVMTVIEDTSGEEPVYKWSAEAAAGGTFYVTATSDGTRWTLNASYQDIKNAVDAGRSVIGVFDDSHADIVRTQYRQLETLTIEEGTSYKAVFGSGSGYQEFTASSATANMVEA